MLSKWESNTPSVTSHVMSNQQHVPHIRKLSTILPQIKNHTQKKINSSSHSAPCSNKSKKNYKRQDLNQLAIKLCRKNWWQMMEISSILFDFQTLELIFQSLQPSQNRARDPRGTPEHGTSIRPRRRPWNRQASSRIGEVAIDINPTCDMEAELGIQIATETVLNGTYWKNQTAQQATFYS